MDAFLGTKFACDVNILFMAYDCWRLNEPFEWQTVNRLLSVLLFYSCGICRKSLIAPMFF